MNHKREFRIGIKRNWTRPLSVSPGSECQEDKKATKVKHRGIDAVRAGQASIEIVVTTAVMVPCVGIILFTGLQVCKQVYMTATNALSWPFM